MHLIVAGVSRRESKWSQWVTYTLLADKYTMQAGYTVIILYPNKSSVNIYLVFLLSLSAVVYSSAVKTLKKCNEYAALLCKQVLRRDL